MDTPKVPQNIVELLAKGHFSEWTLDEQAMLDRWLELDPNNQRLLDALQSKEDVVADLKRFRSFDTTKAWNRHLHLLHDQVIEEDRIYRFNWKKALYVAAAIALIAGFVFTQFVSKEFDKEQDFQAFKPGKNEATITLADGTVVPLQSTEEGLIVGDDLRYESGSVVQANSKENSSFEMNTPRGGQYKLTLPDGSRVWMNSETRLAYTEDPQQRAVDMDGEAYFEVKPQWTKPAHSKENLKPFTVKANNQVVKVMGTHFNVKAYKEDSKTYTTLLEGSVHVKTDKQQIVLYPGEQSILSEGMMNKKKVDVDAVMAWKQGFFVFNAEPLGEILKQVGRWYNVDFVIESDRLKTETFEVMVPRFGELEELLVLLQKTGKLKFKNSGRVIYVTEK